LLAAKQKRQYQCLHSWGPLAAADRGCV